MKRPLTVLQELNSLDFATNLKLVHFLLRHLTPTVAWGVRIVTPRVISPYEEASQVPLDSLVQKVVEASEKRRQAADLSAQERIEGLAIFHQLEQFYTQTDQMWSLAPIWEYYSNGYATRLQLLEKMEKNFRV